jgi:hypothetical protein
MAWGSVKLFPLLFVCIRATSRNKRRKKRRGDDRHPEESKNFGCGVTGGKVAPVEDK